MRRVGGLVAVLLILGLAAAGFVCAQNTSGGSGSGFTRRIDLKNCGSDVAAYSSQSRK
jgi:hypothetical protein